MVFFHEDFTGGWQRLDTRLKPNNLVLTGSKAPANPSEIPATLQEQVDRCLSEGACNVEVPKESLPYKELAIKLESLGLIKPIGKASSTSGSSSTTPPEGDLSAKHRGEV